MQSARVTTARLDASWNSEEFYLRQGYIPNGHRSAADTRRFSKPLNGIRLNLVQCEAEITIAQCEFQSATREPRKLWIQQPLNRATGICLSE